MPRIVGISFPFRQSSAGFPAPAYDGDSINDSLRQIIEVSAGERPMRPTVGSRVIDMLFENNSPLLRAKLQREVRNAIREQEKRVTVISVDVDLDESSAGNAVTIDIVYKLSGRVYTTSVELDGRDAG